VLATVALLGSSYEGLGEIGVAEIPPRLALAISRGRFPKGYPHVDPNEDAAFAAAAASAVLMAVVDGHNGFVAALTVVDAFTAIADDLLSSCLDDPAVAVTQALAAAVEAVGGLPDGPSGAALSVAAVAAGRGAAGTFGDTVATLVGRRKARLLTGRTEFLHAGEESCSASTGDFEITDGEAVVLVTDGVTDFAGRDSAGAVRRAVWGFGPQQAARNLVELGFAGGAGDNLAAAVFVSGGLTNPPGPPDEAQPRGRRG
jgi:serine/threonine protein phosphatase PrpC